VLRVREAAPFRIEPIGGEPGRNDALYGETVPFQSLDSEHREGKGHVPPSEDVSCVFGPGPWLVHVEAQEKSRSLWARSVKIGDNSRFPKRTRIARPEKRKASGSKDPERTFLEVPVDQ
jgi:hypothetical protein